MDGRSKRCPKRGKQARRILSRYNQQYCIPQSPLHPTLFKLCLWISDLKTYFRKGPSYNDLIRCHNIRNGDENKGAKSSNGRPPFNQSIGLVTIQITVESEIKMTIRSDLPQFLAKREIIASKMNQSGTNATDEKERNV